MVLMLTADITLGEAGIMWRRTEKVHLSKARAMHTSGSRDEHTADMLYLWSTYTFAIREA